jgi:hypothetical protein
MPAAPVEWVELRVAWEIPAARWSFSEQSAGIAPLPDKVELWEYRQDPDSDDKIRPECVNAHLYVRDVLPADAQIAGPAIIVETDATTYVPTDWVGRTTTSGYLRIFKNEHKA